MADLVLFFSSNADTMIATKALKDAGISAKMIPKPPTVTTASNLCLAIDTGAESQAKSALTGAGVALGGVVK
jgi:hypothetical protein